MSYMAEGCGAWQVGADPDRGAVRFRVFFPAGVDPHVVSIRVAGTFQSELGGTDWDFPSGLPLTEDAGDPRGTFWTGTTGQELTTGFYEYKYLVTFDDGEARIVTDPCARYGGLSHANSGIVVGGSSPAENVVRPLPGGRRSLDELTVYELMIDDFTADFRAGRAPLDAVIDRLDHLEDLGVGAVLFMPWTAWRNPLFDWGYEPFQYFSVCGRYADAAGRPEEKLSWLKRLVSACHDRGLHVVMDGVYNHVSVEFPYRQLYRDPKDCPYTARTFGGSFEGLQDLDFENPCTGEFIIDVCRYWIDNFGIDGIRFDNTVNFHVPGSLRGLPELLSELATETNFSLTLEHIDVSAATVTNDTAATSFWDNSLHDRAFHDLWHGRLGDGLLNALNNRRFLTAGKVPTLYLSNHDHAQVAWRAGARDNVGAVGGWWRTQPYVIALLTSTAVPLLPNGQEFGEDHFLPENDQRTGRRVLSRPLRWKQLTDPIGRTLHALHRRLVTLRRDHPALRSPHMWPAQCDPGQRGFNAVGAGVDLDRQLAVYHRWAQLQSGDIENFVVVLNFSARAHTLEVPFPRSGRWVDVLAGFDGSGVTWDLVVTGPSASVTVDSHFGRVLLFKPLV